MGIESSTTTDGAAPGLREAKKRETRQVISDQATRLFIQRGFERTTIAEIAAAARVAKKTVTNYFPRKEDLALDHQDAFVASLARCVADRASGEPALTALRRAFLAAVAAQDPLAGFAGPLFTRMIAESPALTTCLRGLHDQREEALARALAEDTGAAPDAIAPRTAAALIGGVHRVLFRRIQDLTLAGYPNPEVAKVVEPEAIQAFALLEPSLAHYAVAR
ncbi:TetR family transcriptional regulator [Streptomyces sp. NPDC057702]|uniref:TetR family transcriptional regulator n=1 Tax=unclassified Streptomyces TaxID=2593676 RepID=UPI0036C8DAB7